MPAPATNAITGKGSILKIGSTTIAEAVSITPPKRKGEALNVSPLGAAGDNGLWIPGDNTVHEPFEASCNLSLAEETALDAIVNTVTDFELTVGARVKYTGYAVFLEMEPGSAERGKPYTHKLKLQPSGTITKAAPGS